MLGRYDQAKQLLLPPGSWRRALYERVRVYTAREATEILTQNYRPAARPFTVQSMTVPHGPLADGIIEPPRA